VKPGLFNGLVVLVVVLLAANLLAYYVLHPPAVVTVLGLVVLGAALWALGRYGRPPEPEGARPRRRRRRS